MTLLIKQKILRYTFIIRLYAQHYVTAPLSYFSAALLLYCATSTLAAAPKKIVIGHEDTVYGIAYQHGISTRTLIAANNIKHPYTLTPGQILLIPGPNEHIVGGQETLQSIAENYGVRVDVLAQENSLPAPYLVRQGDSLIIPSRDTESFTEALTPASPEIVTSSLAPLPLVKVAPEKSKGGPAETIATDTEIITNASPSKKALPEDLAAELAQEKDGLLSSDEPVLMGNLADKKKGAAMDSLAPLKTAEKEEKPKEKKAVKKTEEKPKEKKKTEEKKEPKEKKQAEKKDTEIMFLWPVQGNIISSFGGENKNDGINIQVEEGTPVKAAASGTVMYAGSELKGFGNLLLIKHTGGYVTAYAHLSELLVTKGDTVKKGEVIAKSGKTGDVKEAQLHFELRKGKQPIDPSSKLE